MRRSFWIFALIFFMGVYLLLADIIVFKNGNSMKVSNLKINEKNVTYKIDGFLVTVPLKSVDLEATKKANKTKEAKKDDSIVAQREKRRKDLISKRHEGKVISSLSQISHKTMSEEEEKRYIKNWVKNLPNTFIRRRLPAKLTSEGIDFQIPFRRSPGNLLIVDGIINKYTHADFIFDTGASITALSMKTAKAAKVEIDWSKSFSVNTAGGIVEAFPGLINDFRLDDLKFINVPCMVITKTDQNLIGQNIISIFDFHINYHQNIITLSLKKRRSY